MKTLIATVAAAAALAAVAAPAAAQYRGDHDRWEQGRYDRDGRNGREVHSRVDDRQEAIARDVRTAVRSGALTRHELTRINAETREIERLEARYVRNGLNAAELRDLNRRLGHLEVVVRHERQDREYASGYGNRR